MSLSIFLFLIVATVSVDTVLYLANPMPSIHGIHPPYPILWHCSGTGTGGTQTGGLVAPEDDFTETLSIGMFAATLKSTWVISWAYRTWPNLIRTLVPAGTYRILLADTPSTRSRRRIPAGRLWAREGATN